MQTLGSRVPAQIAVTNTLIVHRDSRATIDLAMAMKADSKLMKRLSLVTVISLPAAFLATFFSMTFFHIGGSDELPALEVSRWIRLYPLCAVPLTLFLVFQYGLDTKLQKLLQTALAQSRSYFSDRAGDSEAQADGGEGVTGSPWGPERK